MKIRRLVVLLLGATVLFAGCAKAPIEVPANTTVVTPTLHLTSDENGIVVPGPTGVVVVVTLTGTSWTFAKPSADVLVAVGDALVDPGAGCPPTTVPGLECGTVTATFHAVKPGTSVISATRTTCGEAIRCVGDQGRYSVTIKIGHP